MALLLTLFDRDQVSYDWQHYIPLLERKPGALRNGAPFAEMPSPLLSLQRALRKRPGGDRVLACVPVHGLDVVIAAVNRCLESGHIQQWVSLPRQSVGCDNSAQ